MEHQLRATSWDESRTMLLTQMSFSFFISSGKNCSFFENLRMSSLSLSSVITLSLSAESWAFHIGSGHSVAQSLQSCRGPPVCSDSVSVISSSEQPV